MIEDIFPHVGEIILKSIFNEDKTLLADLLGIEEAEIRSVHRQLPLRFMESSVIFDGFSTLDLGILLESNWVVPVEVKLGRFGLAQAAVNKMLTPCSISAHASEQRVSGKLFAILNRYFSDELLNVVSGHKLSTIINKQNYPIDEKWVVIARDCVISSWAKKPPGFNGLQSVISIEETCSRYGRENFNNLVNGLFSGLDYFDAWFPENV